MDLYMKKIIMLIFICLLFCSCKTVEEPTTNGIKYWDDSHTKYNDNN